MLKSMQAPVLQTYIMYQARLSYDQLKKYHNLLIKKKMIRETDGKWVATEKGRSYLDAYTLANHILEDD